MAIPLNSTSSDITEWHPSVYKSLMKTKLYQSVDSEKNHVEELSEGRLVVVLGKGMGKKSNFLKLRKYGTLNDSEQVVYYAKSSQFVMNKNNLSQPETNSQTYESFLIDIADNENYIAQSTNSLFQNTSQKIKIKDAELGKPYKEDGKYNIVLDTGFSSIAAIEHNFLDISYGTTGKYQNLKFVAFKALLDHYGKQAISGAKMMNIVVSDFDYIKASEPYISTRPGQNLLIKFSVDEKYFQIFDDIDWSMFSIDNIDKDFIACNIRVDELDKTTNSLVKVLENYDKNISKFSGQIDGLDLKGLSNDLRKFLSQFKKYLSQNEVVVNSEDSNKLELGFNKNNYRLEYVLYFDPYGRFMKIGMKSFCKLFNVKISKLLISHKDILSASMAGIGWMDFIKDYFAGEFKINFVKSGNLASNAKKAMTKLKDQLNDMKSDFEELSLMIPEDISSISNLKKDDKFMKESSELLMRSKDLVGDNFLINLPDILANVDDLETLYTLVFDKVSVKDLVDIMIENLAENLDLPDLNEVKIRGVFKAIKHDEVLKLLPEILDGTPQTKTFLMEILENIDTDETFLDKFVSSFEYLDVEEIIKRLIHIDQQGAVGGVYAKHYVGELLTALEENGVNLLDDLNQLIEEGNFRFSEYYQPDAAKKTLLEIVTDGITHNADGQQDLISIGDLKIGMFDFLKKLNDLEIANGVDQYLKKRFKEAKTAAHNEKLNSINGALPTNDELPSELVEKLVVNKKIKFQLDKLNLTKKKLLKKIPGIDINLENKKLDAPFTIPSIKKVNPSFDFSKFQFENMGDIFGSAIESIEKSLKDGIENALVNTFKDLLNRTLEALNNDTPDIGSPDFGGINMNDIFDATGGFGAEIMCKLALPKLESSIEIFDPDFCEGALDISNFQPTEINIKIAFDDMSSALKPLELIRILKGQKNKKDYNNMVSAIQDPEMRQVFTEGLFNEIIDTAADFVDLTLLEEIENAYDDKEVLTSVCENAGIPYCGGDIKKQLEAKYPTFTDEEICEIIENMVDDVKDSLVGSIGNLKEDHSDNLPFNEDPCSFMPKPTSIDPLNFVNDLAFNSIFDPIEMEYKAEAALIPDLFLASAPSEEYIPMYYYAVDQMFTEHTINENTGLPEFEFKSAEDTEAWEDDDLSENQTRIYNQNFNNHYTGLGTPLYVRGELYRTADNNIAGGEYSEVPLSKLNNPDDYDFKLNTNTGNWQCEFPLNLHVRNTSQKLEPIPEIVDFFENPTFGLTKMTAGSQAYPNTPQPYFDADDIYIAAYFSGIEQPYFILYGANGTITTSYSKIDTSNPSIECSEVHTSSYSTDISILTALKRRIENINEPTRVLQQPMKKPYSVIADLESMRFGLGSDPDLEKSIKLDPGRGTHNFYDTVDGNVMEIAQINEILLRSRDLESIRLSPLPLKIISEFVKQVVNSFGVSPLLETKEMLAFVVDNSDINLFKLQDAKNSAKDAFSESCGFDEGDRSLKSSSMAKLVYLTIRIHIIEKVMRNCFMYSISYPEKADDAFIASIYNKMQDEMSKYPNNFINNIFKKNYRESYNQEFEVNSSTFQSMVTEIYLDIKLSFDELFRKNKGSIEENIISSLSYDTNVSTESDMLTLFESAYESHFQEIDRSRVANNSRFVIQRAVRIPYTSIAGVSLFKEIQWGDATDSQKNNPNNTLVLKLCYLFSGDAFNEDNVVNFITPSMIASPDQIQQTYNDLAQQILENPDNPIEPWWTMWLTAGDVVGDELDSLIYNMDAYDHTIRSGVYRIQNSTSHEYTVYENGTNKKMYYLLPLGIQMTPGSPQDQQTKSRHDEIYWNLENEDNIKKTIIATAHHASGEMTSEPIGIYGFFHEIMHMEYIVELVSSLMESRVLFSKPSIINMFSDTKSALRNAMTSLHQEDDNYAYQENETSQTQQEQASEISTQPEFSDKASKMALMTVPMIIKGMAEMFDPNIQLASVIRKSFQQTGIDIPPPVASLMAMPMNLVPMAPGPPITPLGLLYLGTSYLEPKERKRLSDLLRGKNLNTGADPETGGFEEGTFQEQQDTAVLVAIEKAEDAIAAYEGLADIFLTYLNTTTSIMKNFSDAMKDYGDGAGEEDSDIDELDKPNDGGDINDKDNWKLSTKCSNYSYTSPNAEYGLSDSPSKRNDISRIIAATVNLNTFFKNGPWDELLSDSGIYLKVLNGMPYDNGSTVHDGLPGVWNWNGKTWKNWTTYYHSHFIDFTKYLNHQLVACRQKIMLDIWFMGKVFEYFELSFPDSASQKIFKNEDKVSSFRTTKVHLTDVYNVIKDKSVSQVLDYADDTYKSIHHGDGYSRFVDKVDALSELRYLALLVIGYDAHFTDMSDSYGHAFNWMFSKAAVFPGTPGKDDGVMTIDDVYQQPTIANNCVIDEYEWKYDPFSDHESTYYDDRLGSNNRGLHYADLYVGDPEGGLQYAEQSVYADGIFAAEMQGLKEAYKAAIQTLGQSDEFTPL